VTADERKVNQFPHRFKKNGDAKANTAGKNCMEALQFHYA
jgi:hypothetical protein